MLIPIDTAHCFYPYISMKILHTVLYTFPLLLIRKIFQPPRALLVDSEVPLHLPQG